MGIRIDRSRIFREISSKLSHLETQNRKQESIFFGINNTNVFKSGSVTETGTLLRILDVDEWKRELSIYCASGIAVKAIECFKGEVTQVVYFNEIDSDQAFELRYYALEWTDANVDKSNTTQDALETIDPRINVLPRELTAYEYLPTCIYIYAELKPLITTGWKSCCVCGIQRAETLKCAWNNELDFCSPTCQSIAWSQKKHDEKTSVGGDVCETEYVHVNSESEEMKALKTHLKAISL